jgi:hypothetical protein
LFLYDLFFLQKIGIPENKNDTADGIHSHDAGEEKSQVAMINTHAVVNGCLTTHFINFAAKKSKEKNITS